MRHQRKTVKLGRSQAHRDALLANLAASLLEHDRIKTTIAKAKAVRPFAEKLVTLAKRGTLHARRRAASILGNTSHRTEKVVRKLFGEIAERTKARAGGYLRIIKLGQRYSDAAPMAYIEFVDAPAAKAEVAEPKAAKKPAKKKPAAKAEEAAAKTEEKPARKPRAKKAGKEGAE